jgi:type I pantothenate kinase
VTDDKAYGELSDHLRAAAAGATPPFVVAVVGSVAVGKTTTARIVGERVAMWPERPRVELVSTDGFLHPNDVLAERGIAHRKGFPESYDRRRLVDFLRALESGAGEVLVPVYSHLTYDIVPGEHTVVRRPDVVVVEGLSVLQPSEMAGTDEPVAADFVDFAIYVDADEALLEAWYVDRFLRLCAEAADVEGAFYHRFAGVGGAELADLARQVWRGVNLPNLHQNIAPTRALADVVVEKGPGHEVVALHLQPR